jgi:hypothetical protein
MFFKRRQTSGEEEGKKPGEVAWRTLQELMQKQPAEVAGNPLEPVYYTMKVSELLRAGKPTEARLLLEETVKKFSVDFSVRFHGAMLFEMLGDEVEAAAQLGVTLALEPTLFPAHSRLAYLLLRRGEPEAAERLLEIGWSHLKKLTPKKKQVEERDRYFSFPKRRLAADDARNAGGS